MLNTSQGPRCSNLCRGACAASVRRASPNMMQCCCCRSLAALEEGPRTAGQSMLLCNRRLNLCNFPRHLQDTKLAPQCSAVGLQSFPTWIINGEKLEGEQSFAKLEEKLESLSAAK